ncbi:tetratricopeptide repeat protein 7B-like [Pecten maximus]|uniref:tetratricopeptide repeat protein 7B-like n=1 Tax=Pecten maximus TaxID=6579 RepID=UPI001457F816|nr:tetratricopeptide repeat protein 7B-like [Pecten maximus]
MTAKTKFMRLESEIEKYRNESCWIKASELARQLSSKSSELDYYEQFTLAESHLEEYLKENPPIEKNSSKARAHLADAEKQLKLVAKVKNKLSLDANLLLAKISYSQGQYETALEIFDDHANLDNLATKDFATTRQLQIVAESFAIKGMCIERVGPSSTSKFRVAEQEEKIISCYEKSGDLALLYLQERDRTGSSSSSGVSPSPTPSNPQEDNLGMILETALQQSPILYIKRGNLDKGVNRFRDLLRVVESRFTQGLRQTLARQLAEVLLRGMCENSYIPIGPVIKPTSLSTHSLQPRKYSGDRQFVPRDENEEALLLLLIAEAIATREAVLNRTEEHDEARLHSFMNTTVVFDLLAVALVKRAQFNKLSESFERAMRFSFEEFHIWHQFANSLICAGKYTRALLVLKECSRLKPQNCTVLLQGAKLCYEYLHQYMEGIRLSEQALQCLADEHPLCARVHVSLGIGYSLAAMEMRLQVDRQQYNKKALSAFNRAHMYDPSDYLALFHLSLQLAIHRQINDAIKNVRLALRYRNDHIHSLHLLVLLLTAQKQFDEAISLLNAALDEYPENLSLMLTKSRLEEILYGPEQALATCKHMLQLWKELYEVDTEEAVTDVRSSRRPTATDRTQFDRRSFAQLQLTELNERDTGSLRAESIAASRVEQTMSEVASSLNSTFQPRPGSQQTWLLQAQIWLHLAELYLTLDKMSEAEACVVETSTIFPLSHQVAFMKGRVLEHKLKYNEAKLCYEDAISINPGHTKSLQHLGMVLHQLENDKMAEKVLRDAVNTDPVSHESWYLLGLVLETLGQDEAATDCHTTALELEASSPTVPFTVIPRLMQ